MSTPLRRGSRVRTPQRLAIGLCVVGVAALQAAAFHGVRGDDAFIASRYGQNLAAGPGAPRSPALRFLVVDQAYYYSQLRPPSEPSFVEREGGFEASVYELPEQR